MTPDHPDPEARAKDQARELLRAHLREPWETRDYHLMDAIAAALREREAQGYQRGIEDAAKEADYYVVNSRIAENIARGILALAKQGGKP